MARPRVFSSSGSESGAYHVVSRIVDRQFRLGETEKESFAKMMQAFAVFHQVEILTYCVMGNHFHLLVRVPERPAGFSMKFDGVMALWERAVGVAWLKGVKRQFEIFDQSGSGEAGREAWRQQMLGRMFSLSAFMKSLKQRFTAWYNRRNDRVGTLWEGRFKSVIVEDEQQALRTMATYIDLNPVRAKLTDDPGKYRWCGYAEAMAGEAEAIEGIVKIAGMTAANVYGGKPGEAANVESAPRRKSRQLRAIVAYRQLLGIAGRERIREDGTVVRRGVSEKVRARFEGESGVKREQLMVRVRHFTQGVIIGSRGFIDEWFERNRNWFRGKSRTERKTGARSIGKGWKVIYNLRQLKQ